MKNFKTKPIAFSLLIVAVVALFIAGFAVEQSTIPSVETDALAYTTKKPSDSLANVENRKDAENSELMAARAEIEAINEKIETIENQTEVLKSKCLATYYHDMFNGRYAADGSVFSNDELTAAHKTLPFGTKVRVTNLQNKKSVIVIITDRGPYIKNKEIDLTKKAFSTIGKLRKGNLKVKLEILPEDYEDLQDLVDARDALIETHFGDQIEAIQESLKHGML